jgi:hypothetical protein
MKVLVAVTAGLTLAGTYGRAADADEFAIGGVTLSELQQRSHTNEGIPFITGAPLLEGNFMRSEFSYLASQGVFFDARAGQTVEDRARALRERAAEIHYHESVSFVSELRCANYRASALPRCPAEFSTNPNLREYVIYFFNDNEPYSITGEYAGHAGYEGMADLLRETYPTANVVLRDVRIGEQSSRTLYAELPGQRLTFTPLTRRFGAEPSQSAYRISVTRTGDALSSLLQSSGTAFLDQLEAEIDAWEVEQARIQAERDNARPSEF